MMSETIVVKSARDLAAVFKANETARFARMNRGVIAAAMIGTRILRSRVPIDTGRLRRETKLVYHGGAAGILCEIVEDTPYASAMEAGTRPMQVPLRPLFEWAKRQAPNLGIDASDKRALFRFAKGVQKAIAAHGLKARWATRDALPELRRVLGTMLVRALKPGEAVMELEGAAA
jgi:hypothetical protein